MLYVASEDSDGLTELWIRKAFFRAVAIFFPDELHRNCAPLRWLPRRAIKGIKHSLADVATHTEASARQVSLTN